jgi:hypothetical protein
MTSCNNYDDELKKLQEDNARLQKELDVSERARKAGEMFLRTEAKRQWVIPMQDGSARSITDAEIDRAYTDFAARLESEELDALVQRGLGNRAKPIGSEGRFVNYRQLIENANIQDAEEYAKLTEALVGTWRQAAPEDFAFVTATYGRDRLLQSVADAYREFTDADTIAAALANNTAGFMALAEKMTRLRFIADMAKGSYLDTLGQIIEFMDNSSAPVPDGLRRRGFSTYKLALMAERHVSTAKRNTGQALRSLQEDFAAPHHFAVDMAEAKQTLGATAQEVVRDEHFGQVMDAIDGRKPEEIKQLKIAASVDGFDPRAKLGKGWANSHMRFGNALVKDSQLLNFGSQVRANAIGSWLANTHGFVHQAFENIGNLTPHGTRFSREAFGEGLRVAWESAAYSHDGVRRAWRELAADSFFRGDAPFGGNVDTYGARGNKNEKLLADVQAVIEAPYPPGGPLDPRWWAMNVHKLQASTRMLAYHWTGQNPAVLIPALRAMSASDSVLGYDAFLFKLKNDLEIRARKDGAQLGLFDARSREEWVQGELDKAFYQAAPTEENIKSFRRQHNLKDSDITDGEIAQIITADRVRETYGYPTLDSPEAVGAMDYSLRNRMQAAPTGEFAGKIDEAVMKGREHWAIDSLVPYWRAPFNQFLFDTRLSFGPLAETVHVVFGKNPTKEQIAKVQAGWVVTGGLLGMFAGLDMMGLIEGNGPLDPTARRAWLLEGNRPNSIGGVPYLGGLPILNTLFLWKDIKETFVTGSYSSFDQHNAFWGVAQVLTSQLIRQTGFGQLQRLVDALLDPETAMPRLVQWLGQGQLPGSGVMRDMQRLTGSSGTDFYRDQQPGPAERFALGEDDPATKIERNLRNLAFGTIPLMGLAGGAPRKTNDFLGSPIMLEFGADWADTAKAQFLPRIWPRPHQRVYAELDAQGRLTLPNALLRRQLEGVAMSDELQAEYSNTYGTVKGSIPLEARMELAGAKVAVTFPLPKEVSMDLRQEFKGSGVVVAKGGENATVELAPFLAKHVKGRTILEAFTSLFNDPVYQRMQDRPGTTSDLEVRDMPAARRRSQAASQMIQGVYTYFHLLTLDQLNASSTPAATDWRDRRSRMAAKRFTEATGELRDLVEAINPGAALQR